MFQFLETIQLLDGKFSRLRFHQARMDKALSEHFPYQMKIQLETSLLQTDFPLTGLYKCRVVYDYTVISVEYIPYTAPIIRTLKVLDTQIPSLTYKIADRSAFQDGYSKRGECDDVLFCKNGLLTDSSYCNIALWDGKIWVTPRTPLVFGVNRAELIENKQLIENDIFVKDILNFQYITLFNAMNEMSSICLDVSRIKT
jgi:4-amino-4-deoxychorismate lyase